MNDKSPTQIAELLPLCDGPVFDVGIYRSVGLFVIRNLFPAAMVSGWQVAWNEFQINQLAMRKVGFNKVAVTEILPENLANLYDTAEHMHIAQEIFGNDLGLYNHRFVIKDQFSRDEIFLHQDFCYQLGFAEKASFFTPLSVCGRQNGGLEFFLGTHQYGYLGDAGEIDPSKFPAWPSLRPELEPGDLVVMNSSLWHRSGLHIGGPDRIISDAIVQPACDPSTVKLLRGEKGPVNLISRSGDGMIFKRSRISRMQELTEELAVLKAAQKDLPVQVPSSAKNNERR